MRGGFSQTSQSSYRLKTQVTSYAHGSSDLLGIQIDAAINPGQSILEPFPTLLSESIH